MAIGRTPNHLANDVIGIAYTPAGLDALAIALLRGADMTDAEIEAKAQAWTSAKLDDAF